MFELVRAGFVLCTSSVFVLCALCLVLSVVHAEKYACVCVGVCVCVRLCLLLFVLDCMSLFFLLPSLSFSHVPPDMHGAGRRRVATIRIAASCALVLHHVVVVTTYPVVRDSVF